MRKAKLWSVLLAAVLLCACVVGVLFVGASAGTEDGYTTFEYTVEGETTDAANLKFATFMEAINYANTNASVFTQQKSKLVITLKKDSTFTTGHADNLLFGIPTLWSGNEEVGIEKLKITIKGENKSTLLTCEKTKSLSVYGTNDYIFDTLTLDFASSGSSYYCGFNCGCGYIRFDNVTISASAAGSKLYTYLDGTSAQFNNWQTKHIDAVLKTAEGETQKTYTVGFAFGNGTTWPTNNYSGFDGNRGIYTSSSDNSVNAGSDGKTIGNKCTKYEYSFEEGSDFTRHRIYGAMYVSGGVADAVTIKVGKGVPVHTVYGVTDKTFLSANKVSIYFDGTICERGNGVRAVQNTDYKTRGSKITVTDKVYLEFGPNIVFPTGANDLDGSKPNKGQVLQAAFSNQSSSTYYSFIVGDLSVLYNGVDKTKDDNQDLIVFGNYAFCTGNVEVTLKNVKARTVKCGFERQNTCKSLKTTIEGENTQITNFYGAGSADLTLNPSANMTGVWNIVKGGTITNYYGGSSAGTLSSSIKNDFIGGKIHNFYGTGAGAVTGDVTNTFDGTCTINYKDGLANTFVYSTQIAKGADNAKGTLNTAGSGAVTGTVTTVLKCVHLGDAKIERIEGDVLNYVGEEATDCVTLPSSVTLTFDNFDANGAYIVAYNANLTINNAKGEITFRSTGTWEAGRVYATFTPATGETIKVHTAQSLSITTRGVVYEDAGKTIVAGGLSPEGAKLHLKERITMKVYFAASSVEAIGLDQFTFGAVLGDSPLIPEAAALTKDGDYYYFETSGIGIGDYTENITISGKFIPEVKTTILALAESLAGDENQPDWKPWAESLINLINVIVKDQTGTLTPEDKDYSAFSPVKGTATAGSVALVMNSAVGIKFDVTFPAPLTNAKVLVNGEYDYTDLYNNGSMTFFITPAAMETPFDIQIFDGENEVFALNQVSIAYLAEKLHTEGNSDATALLAYVQATAAAAMIAQA